MRKLFLPLPSLIAVHIDIPLHAPRPFSSGKMLTVTSSNGNKPTTAMI
jgi:hypothetical protein